MTQSQEHRDSHYYDQRAERWTQAVRDVAKGTLAIMHEHSPQLAAFNLPGAEWEMRSLGCLLATYLQHDPIIIIDWIAHGLEDNNCSYECREVWNLIGSTGRKPYQKPDRFLAIAELTEHPYIQQLRSLDELTREAAAELDEAYWPNLDDRMLQGLTHVMTTTGRTNPGYEIVQIGLYALRQTGLTYMKTDREKCGHCYQQAKKIDEIMAEGAKRLNMHWT